MSSRLPRLMGSPSRIAALTWVVAALVAAMTSVMSTAGAQPQPRPIQPTSPAWQAISLLGDTLRALPLSATVRARYDAQMRSARAAYEHTPTNVDSIIWYARRLGYLGQLRESIQIYSAGIALYPNNPWLYRHRGHRYLSVRDFDAAIRDLERARQLTAGKPDEVEPDGQPNAQNTPIGTLQSNIGYHLALGYYLKGDFESAVRVARAEVMAASNDDRRVSMAHWLYLSLRRLGRDAEAAQAVAPMTRDLNVIENDNYHRLMGLYRGELSADALLKVNADGSMSVEDASSAYGIATWHWVNGRRTEAAVLLRRLVAAGQWGAFGTIAAEADLARLPR